ncbi:MAG TPA: ABC transporter permease [Cyclobacteriaceae bacterium]|nr:ABC transporter permease [Cyclobacteriaceae bacterium]
MIEPKPIVPPRWPLRLLRLFVKERYLEEIEGDMEEIFYDNVEQLSARRARRIYTWEMLKLWRPILVRNLEVLEKINQYAMLKNYFKVSLRGLMKNPLNSFINVFGLSAAIGICVFAYAFAAWTFGTDQFHEHKSEVYLITFFANRDGVPQQFGRSPRPLGEMIKEDFAQVRNMCRVEDRNVVMKYKDYVFHERVRYVDPAFLEMFTFPLKWGTTNSLKDVSSIVLSEDMATKYFGAANPVGLDILMIFGTGAHGESLSKSFKVTGVAKEFPQARTISFDFLINYDNLRTTDPNYDFHDWNAFVNATFVQLNEPNDLKIIEQSMEKYRKVQNEAVQKDWALSSFAFEPLATLHKRSEFIRDDISRSSSSNYASIVYMCIIAVLIMALACFNYINIAIATAAKRLKEIGLRKTIGATRGLVIFQFLAENVVVTFFALIVGVTLGMTFFIPGFEQMWHFNMGFKLTDPNLWIYLPIILVMTSVASGIYPSLYISRFQVVGILKGSIKFGQRNSMTKIFLCAQLALACVFITMSVMFTQNNSYMAKRSWGYDHAQTMYAQIPDKDGYEELYALMLRNKDIVSISGSSHHLGKTNGTVVLHFPEREVEVDQMMVDAHYFETMGLKIEQGRLFKNHDNADKHAVIINELMAKNMAWANAVDQHFQIDSVQYEVIGVVKDFHSYSFSKPIKPTIFTVADKNDYRFLTLKVREGSEVETFKAMQANWAKLFPEIPFEGGFQEDVWAGYFEANRIYKIVWSVFTFIAVSLAVLGLYGLITLNVAGRIREFSIRKVMGAGIKSIAANIINQYLVLFVLALIVGAPLGFVLTKMLFETSFPYHMPVGFSSSILAVVILILILLSTVFAQIRKVQKMNPVDGLKVE